MNQTNRGLWRWNLQCLSYYLQSNDEIIWKFIYGLAYMLNHFLKMSMQYLYISSCDEGLKIIDHKRDFSKWKVTHDVSKWLNHLSDVNKPNPFQILEDIQRCLDFVKGRRLTCHPLNYFSPFSYRLSRLTLDWFYSFLYWNLKLHLKLASQFWKWLTMIFKFRSTKCILLTKNKRIPLVHRYVNQKHRKLQKKKKKSCMPYIQVQWLESGDLLIGIGWWWMYIFMYNFGHSHLRGKSWCLFLNKFMLWSLDKPPR